MSRLLRTLPCLAVLLAVLSLQGHRAAAESLAPVIKTTDMTVWFSTAPENIEWVAGHCAPDDKGNLVCKLVSIRLHQFPAAQGGNHCEVYGWAQDAVMTRGLKGWSITNTVAEDCPGTETLSVSNDMKTLRLIGRAPEGPEADCMGDYEYVYSAEPAPFELSCRVGDAFFTAFE